MWNPLRECRRIQGVAKLNFDEVSLTVALTAAEQAEALHGDLRVARSHIAGARAVPDGVAVVPGLRAAAMRTSGVVMIGTWRSPDATTFAACYGRRPAVVLDLAGSSHDRVVVTVDRPEQVVHALGY